MSGKRSPLKGVLRGEVAWGDDLEGEGSGPRLSGLATGGEEGLKIPFLQAMGGSKGRLLEVPYGRRGAVWYTRGEPTWVTPGPDVGVGAATPPPCRVSCMLPEMGARAAPNAALGCTPLRPHSQPEGTRG